MSPDVETKMATGKGRSPVEHGEDERQHEADPLQSPSRLLIVEGRRIELAARGRKKKIVETFRTPRGERLTRSSVGQARTPRRTSPSELA